jgi:hypothetical protein
MVAGGDVAWLAVHHVPQCLRGEPVSARDRVRVPVERGGDPPVVQAA